MRFTITSQGTDIPLELDIHSYHIEISDLANGSISVSDGDRRLAVCFTEPQPVTAEPVTVEDAATQAALPDTLPEPLQIVEAEQTTDSSEAGTAEVGQAAIPNLEGTEQLEQLFQHLTYLRKQIAAEVNLPPYIIFHDSTLRDMCRLLPTDLDTLSTIPGVGHIKLEKYGLRFIQAIHEFVSHVKEVA